MSDFNVPGSRPKKTRWNFGNRPYIKVLLIYEFLIFELVLNSITSLNSEIIIGKDGVLTVEAEEGGALEIQSGMVQEYMCISLSLYVYIYMYICTTYKCTLYIYIYTHTYVYAYIVILILLCIFILISMIIATSWLLLMLLLAGACRRCLRQRRGLRKRGGGYCWLGYGCLELPDRESAV